MQINKMFKPALLSRGSTPEPSKILSYQSLVRLIKA